MKRIFYLLTLTLTLFCILSSCQKDNQSKPIETADAFEFNGTKYTTLQDAVDAACKYHVDDCTIVLQKDAFCNGAVFPKGTNITFRLLIGAHSFQLNPSSSIDVKDNVVDIIGDGGVIIAKGDDAAITGDVDGIVSFFGNFSLSGECIIESATDISVENGYTGKLSGNITLNNASMRVHSTGFQCEIPVLSVYGSDAVFSEETDDESTHIGRINIEKVLSANKYPIMAFCGEAISVRSGNGTLHIHRFRESTVLGDCVHPSHGELICDECGLTFSNPDADGVLGSCDPKMLIHHARVEATGMNYGNVEYYDCPLCNRRYADADGKVDITDCSLIPPSNEGIMDTLGREAKAVFIAEPSLVDEVVEFLSDIVPAILETAEGFTRSELKDFLSATEKLDEVSGKLQGIVNKLTKIIGALERDAYKKRITTRNEELSKMSADISVLLTSLKLLEQEQLSDEKTLERMITIINQWVAKNPGITDAPPSLMQQFGVVALGLNFPQMYGEVIAGQCIWEHQAYDVWKSMMLRDALVVSASAIMMKLYNEYIRTYNSEISKVEHRKSIVNAYYGYLKTIKDEFGKVEERDKLYRRYMPKNILFSRDACNFNFWKYLDADKSHLYYPRTNEQCRAENNCNRMMIHETVLTNQKVKFMDFDTILQINDYYKKKNDKMNDFISVLVDSVGFKGIPNNKGRKTRLVIDDQRGFGYDEDNIRYPRYRVFSWKCNESFYNGDYFTIYPCLEAVGNNVCKSAAQIIDGNVRTKDGFISNFHQVDRDFDFFTIYAVQ